jgi:hypothetical protein
MLDLQLQKNYFQQAKSKFQQFCLRERLCIRQPRFNNYEANMKNITITERQNGTVMKE